MPEGTAACLYPVGNSSPIGIGISSARRDSGNPQATGAVKRRSSLWLNFFLSSNPLSLAKRPQTDEPDLSPWFGLAYHRLRKYGVWGTRHTPRVACSARLNAQHVTTHLHSDRDAGQHDSFRWLRHPCVLKRRAECFDHRKGVSGGPNN